MNALPPNDTDEKLAMLFAVVICVFALYIIFSGWKIN